MRDRQLALRHARELIASATPGSPSDRIAVKLCGLSREQDVEAANRVRPDMAGFIVDYPSSPRSLGYETLVGLVAKLDAGIAAVGVFVDEAPELVGLAVAAGIDIVQLHGDEDAGYLARLRSTLPHGTPVIQAFRVTMADDVERANASGADLVLLDGGRGQGRAFDWTLLEGVKRPYMLAGGLAPDNVDCAVRQAALAGVRPWGVDMSSGVETDGHKDPNKMAAAVAAVRGLE
jgi:phosphoribosylanthranilate isomerase